MIDSELEATEPGRSKLFNVLNSILNRCAVWRQQKPFLWTNIKTRI